jgi:hypothetical protein
VLHINVNDDDIRQAKERSELVGIMGGSRTSGKGNIVGFLGEILVARLLGVDLADTFHYDLLFGSRKTDVKTKSCSSAPKEHYLCSVMDYQMGNECDYFIFCRVNLASKEAWILGGISKAGLIEGRFAQKGEKDGNFTFTEACWSVPISDLEEIR